MLFSEPVSARYGTLRDQAITATNGEVRKAQRVNGNSAEWNVTVTPDSREAETMSIDGGTDTCGQGDSVWTGDSRQLSNWASVTVEGPPLVPLTAELDNVPAAHDGESWREHVHLRADVQRGAAGRLPDAARRGVRLSTAAPCARRSAGSPAAT